jgi:hypothetical protein
MTDSKREEMTANIIGAVVAIYIAVMLTTVFYIAHIS